MFDISNCPAVYVVAGYHVSSNDSMVFRRFVIKIYWCMVRHGTAVPYRDWLFEGWALDYPRFPCCNLVVIYTTWRSQYRFINTYMHHPFMTCASSCFEEWISYTIPRVVVTRNICVSDPVRVYDVEQRQRTPDVHDVRPLFVRWTYPPENHSVSRWLGEWVSGLSSGDMDVMYNLIMYIQASIIVHLWMIRWYYNSTIDLLHIS